MGIFRCSALYVARRPNRRSTETVFLKVAHTGRKEALKYEASLLNRVNHPVFPRLLPPMPPETRRPYAKLAVQREERHFLVLEYTEGEFLRALLDHTRPLDRDAAYITLGLAEGIAYLHKRHGVLALGVMPESVLVSVDRDGIPRPLLLNLGNARPLDAAPCEESVYWASAYSAPEQMQGYPCSERTDVYQLGLLFYEMLTGQPAHSVSLHKNDQTIRRMLLAGAVVPFKQHRPDLRGTVGHIIHQAIAPAPEQRYRSTSAFGRAVRSVFNSVPSPTKWHNRIDRRVLAGALFVGILLVSIVLILILLPT